MILTKFKNYFSRLIRTQEVEDIKVENTEKNYRQSSLDDFDTTDVASKSIVLQDDTINAIKDYAAENIVVPNEAETYVDDEHLQYFILDDFDMSGAKAMVQERDKKILSQELFKPAYVAKTDKNGNRALLAICAVPTIAYTATVVASAVALPPLAMGLLGFGIAGGAVKGLNTIFGSNSILGSLYRKVRMRFGKVKPKVNLHNYNNAYNIKRDELNASIKEDLDKYTFNLSIKDNIDAMLNEQIARMNDHEDPNLKFEDNEMQAIVDQYTTSYLSTCKKLEKLDEELAPIKQEIDERNIFIEECNSRKAQLEEMSKEMPNDIATTLENIRKSVLTNKDIKNKLAEIEKNSTKEKSALEEKKNKELAIYEEHIKNSKETISKIDPNNQEAVKPIQDSIDICNSMIKNINAKYDEDLAKLLEKTNTEKDNITKDLSNEQKELLNCTNEYEVLKNVTKLINTVISNYPINNNPIITLSENDMKFLVEKALKNEDTAELEKNITEAITKFFDENKAKELVQYDLNIEDCKKELTKLQNKYDDLMKDKNAIYDAGLQTLNNYKQMLVNTINLKTEKSKIKLEQTSNNAKEEMAEFNQDLKKRLKEELYNNPTL